MPIGEDDIRGFATTTATGALIGWTLGQYEGREELRDVSPEEGAIIGGITGLIVFAVFFASDRVGDI